MRVLLADPPYYRFFGGSYQEVCMGILYLGTVLHDRGHTVKIYHTDFEPGGQFPSNLEMLKEHQRYIKGIHAPAHPLWREIIDRIDQFNPDILGMTLLTPKYGSGLMLARLAKEKNPRMKVVVGGPHPSILPNETINEPEFDFCVRGEGEETMCELVQALEANTPLSAVQGLTWKEPASGEIINNPPRGLIHDLDTLPIPDRELLWDMDAFPKRALGVLVTSRGCPFICAFCASHLMWGRKVRYRSLENVLNELKTIKEKYSTTRFSFFDDTFTLNHKRVRELCQRIIDEDLDIKWACTTRADTVTDELLHLMQRAGCEDVFIGIESANNEILRGIGKQITVEKVEQVTRAATEAGLYPCLSFMIGLPGETATEIKSDIEFVRRVDPYNPRPNVAKPFPGTEFYHYAVERSILPEEGQFEWSELFPHNPSYNLAGIPDDEFEQLALEVYVAFHDREMAHVKVRLAEVQQPKDPAEAHKPEPSSKIRRWFSHRKTR